MAEFDPVPESEERSRWQERADTFSRVYDVVLGITSPTPYAEIAEIADCSPNAAKKHLDRLTEIGVVRADTESRPARYERNEAYLEWQEASRIAADLSVEEIIDRVERLEERREAFAAEFDAASPDDVSAFGEVDHETVHERMVSLAEWHGVIRDVRLYELAHQLAQNDGHLLPA